MRHILIILTFSLVLLTRCTEQITEARVDVIADTSKADVDSLPLDKTNIQDALVKVNEPGVVRVILRSDKWGSGVLIDPYTILISGDLAYHGFLEEFPGTPTYGQKDITVRYWRPDTTLGDRVDIGSGTMKVYLNPEYYTSNSWDGDIGMIVKSTPFLDVDNDDFKDIYTGPLGSIQYVYMYGAGYISENGGQTNDVNRIEEKIYINSSNVYAIEDGHGKTCLGDDGGPVTRRSDGAVLGIIGRMVRNGNCTKDNGYMYVSRLDNKIAWIDSIRSLNSLIPCRVTPFSSNLKCYDAALTATVTANSYWSSTYAPSKAADNIKSTKWNSSYCMAAGDAWINPHEFYLDLGAPTTVKSYVMKHAEYRGEYKKYNTQQWDVFSRANTSSGWVWRGEYDNFQQEPISYATEDGSNFKRITPFTDRHVKFTIRYPGECYARISGIELH